MCTGKTCSSTVPSQSHSDLGSPEADVHTKNPTAGHAFQLRVMNHTQIHTLSALLCFAFKLLSSQFVSLDVQNLAERYVAEKIYLQAPRRGFYAAF